jgi:hypothetical protein
MAKEGSIVRKGDYEYQTRGGKSYNFNIVKPEKKATPVKPKPKPKAVKPKPMPDYKGQEQRFPPAPQVEKEDKTRFNPLTNTSLTGGGDVYTGPGAVRARDFGDVRPERGKPVGERFNPLTSTYYKDGGKVRGDGMSRVKTKGRCL